MGYIYKISTTASDKIYIGQTSCSPEKRFKEHIRASRNNIYKSYLYNAMRKYGVDTFSYEVVEECLDSELNEREKYWISFFDSYKNGYNSTIGGEGNTRYNYKEIADKYLELQSEQETANFFNCHASTVKKACEAYGIEIKKGTPQEYWNSEKGLKRKEELSKKTKEFFTGRPVSEESRKKMSESAKNRYKKQDVWNKGKKLTKEHKELLVKNSAMAKPVICIETKKEYSSACQAAKDVGLKSSAGISHCCNGERITAGGYHWKYKETC